MILTISKADEAQAQVDEKRVLEAIKNFGFYLSRDTVSSRHAGNSRPHVLEV